MPPICECEFETRHHSGVPHSLAFLRFCRGLNQQSLAQQTAAYPIVEQNRWLLVVGGYITHNWLLVGCGKSSPWGKVKEVLSCKNKVPQSLACRPCWP